MKSLITLCAVALFSTATLASSVVSLSCSTPDEQGSVIVDIKAENINQNGLITKSKFTVVSAYKTFSNLMWFGGLQNPNEVSIQTGDIQGDNFILEATFKNQTRTGTLSMNSYTKKLKIEIVSQTGLEGWSYNGSTSECKIYR